MSSQAAIPAGRPQPKLSKLVAHPPSENQSKFVFWDLQNTPLPAELCVCATSALELLETELAAARLTVVTEVPASSQPGAELLRALSATKGVELLTFLRAQNQPALGTAADYELKRVCLPSHEGMDIHLSGSAHKYL